MRKSIFTLVAVLGLVSACGGNGRKAGWDDGKLSTAKSECTNKMVQSSQASSTSTTSTSTTASTSKPITTDQAGQFCGCTFDKISKTFTLSEFQAFEHLDESTESDESKLNKVKQLLTIVADCGKASNIPGSDTLDVSGL
jgi:hypothetical protein